MASEKDKQERETLLARYEQLDDISQRILQLASVIYTPVNRTDLTACASKAGIRGASNKAFTSTQLKPHYDKLLEQGLFVQEKSQGPQCHPLIAETLTRQAVKAGHFDAYVKAVQEKWPLEKERGYGWYSYPENQFRRDVRIGVYSGDIDYIQKRFDAYERRGYEKVDPSIVLNELYCTIFSSPLDVEWFQSIPKKLRHEALISLSSAAFMRLTPSPEIVELTFEESENPTQKEAGLLYLYAARHRVLRGEFTATEEFIKRGDFGNYSSATDGLFGQLAFLNGDTETALVNFESALKVIKKNTGKRKIFLPGFEGPLFIFALLANGSSQRLKEAQAYATIAAGDKTRGLDKAYIALKLFIQFQQGDLTAKDSLAQRRPAVVGDSFWDVFCAALAFYWADLRLDKTVRDSLPDYARRAEANGYRWLEMQICDLRGRLPQGKQYAEKADALHKEIGGIFLSDIVKPVEEWEVALEALENFDVAPQARQTEKGHAEYRLAWFIDYDKKYGACSVQPREQKITKSGRWSKGRNVALKRLKESPGELPYLTQQDLRAATHIDGYSYGYYGQTQYEFDSETILALIGHPSVFWEGTSTRVEVVEGQPELRIFKTKRGHVQLQLSPEKTADQPFQISKETPTRLKVVKFTPAYSRLADILGHGKLSIPARAKDRVLKAIAAVSGQVMVHSDIGGGTAGAEEVKAQAAPHFHLLPAGEGLKIALLSRPFPGGGPYYRPGSGGKTVIAEVEGKRLQTTRDLKAEKQLAGQALEACPILMRIEDDNDEWLLDEPEDCLETLLDLQNLGDQAVVEWPEGEKFRISHQAKMSQFGLRIKRNKDWFEASGELKLDQDLVLDMQQLLALLDGSTGRFLPLKDGQFLALTNEFRKRLEELRAYSEKHGKGVRFNPLLAPVMQDLTDGLGQVKTDKAWKDHLERLQEAQSLQPELPSTLQAELRDYQSDGFRWLARLAHWGVGACLADDMGLGKTVQALAAMLTRAPQGPCLVIAPTSVCMNWHNEARRFTPTLNTIQFGAGDRRKTLDELQPFDLLVCTYGLLQQENVAEMLAKVAFEMIVLDEAQAIKNMTTKRSQAAMNLQSPFKVITTGTPVENHLGELWNLFRFLNPGLLGSLDSFNQRFAAPIEKFQNKDARHRLRRLIQPFILRRTKNQVLEELPERTEITLQVELSKEEMAFYEALRQQAVSKLADSDVPVGQKHFQILAEIMRLRRACCNAKLVDDKVSLPSAKLNAFGDILEELLENKHKALVFSQFVDHLSILREYLDNNIISYQYLDGSTPAKQRQERVNAFQAGEGDVFLISLKAGGTGLNLTAADYVIHMDPWWNPAVEDQASDRAHRIGQQRPVTIYRLVAQNTIEEKIVTLHAHKRDLADSLLEGADMSGKVSADELLRLIAQS